MSRQESQMTAAKRSYRHAKDEGNHQEEARWANVIGDMLKNRGEYVEALKWLRVDYEVSMKYLSEKHLLPTCQSLGEVYLRLGSFKDALVYQKKHLEIAKDSANLVEQQRACTQLGRTYHEMFLMSEDDHYSVRNAKKYFKAAMKLARTLRENPPSNTSSFLKEYIDAYNNIGMLEMDLDNLEEAKMVLTKGLDICDEEEVAEDDDGRSRLHHNLGKIYMDLRMWDKARVHIEKDVVICRRIRHCQGEAKGYINLGELHYRVQKYEDAILCYQKALDLAKSMEDEDALVTQIHQNIDIVNEAIKVMEELKKEEQKLKKLTRDMLIAKGTPRERKCLLQQSASLDCLIEKSSMIFAWLKHREFAKRKKRIAIELCDKEKLSDSFLTVGESYQKLRNFKKALKWYTKSLELCKSIGNLEGQALAKINVGDVLDWDGNWTAALIEFEEGYMIAVEAKLPSVQLSALENMHYSHMMRFDNVEEAGRLQLLIDKLKQSKVRETEAYNVAGECCSETDTEGEDRMSNSRSGACCLPEFDSCRSQPHTIAEELNDDAPLISLLRSGKSRPKLRTAKLEKTKTYTKLSEGSPKSLSKSSDNLQKIVGRKRVRIVVSDDEDEMQDESLKGRLQKWSVEDVATSDEFKNKHGPVNTACEVEDLSGVASKCAVSCCSPVNLEESTSSYKSRSPRVATKNSKIFKSASNEEVVNACNSAASGSKCGNDVSKDLLRVHNTSHLMLHTSDDGYNLQQCVTFKIDDEMIHVEVGSCVAIDELTFESMKVELACLYYLQLPIERRSKGLLPIIQHMKCDGRAFESMESIQTLKDPLGKILVEVFVGGWVQKRFIKVYLDCCNELSEAPNMKLLKKLYNLEVSDDEIIVSECELQDISIMPLLNTLHTHRTVSVINLSHNVLGNGTMEKLQQVFSVSGQNCGGLTLDLHFNQFGPTALFQICECPLLFTRLEVLNISRNRLTDACGSYLSTILENCKALYSLNIEQCSITSRTIQKVADALGAESGLAQLCIGYNNPVSGNAIINLLVKLASLKRFSELNLSGLKLSKRVVNSLCGLAKAPCLSGLMLGGTGLGTDGALQLTESLYNEAEELVKLDLSFCGLTHKYLSKLNNFVTPICSMLELNLGGNPIMPEGTRELVSLIKNLQCSLKVLVLNKCQLGLAGVLQIIKAVSENSFLEELNLADNTHPGISNVLQYDLKVLQPNLIPSQSSPKEVCVPREIDDPNLGSCAINTECNHLEVADSEDDLRADTSGFDDSCTSSFQKNSSSRECQFIQELSAAIGMAKQLRLLDISNNGISPQSAEILYTAWSSGLRVDISQRYVKDQTILFSVEGNKSFRVRPCCKKD